MGKMRGWLTGSLGVCALGLVTGCAGISVDPQTLVPRSPQISQSTLVLGEITRPRDLTTSAPFYVAMSRDMHVEIQQAGVAANVLEERDLTPAGVQGRAFALRYRVVEDNVVVTSTGGGCFAALLITGSLILIPIFFIGLCTASADHRMTVEARVFDLNGAQIKSVRDSNSNEMLNVYDTSMLSPLLRREYHVNVSVTVPVNKARALAAHGEEMLELSREEAAEATRQVLAQSLHDVSAVLAR